MKDKCQPEIITGPIEDIYIYPDANTPLDKIDWSKAIKIDLDKDKPKSTERTLSVLLKIK